MHKRKPTGYSQAVNIKGIIITVSIIIQSESNRVPVCYIYLEISRNVIPQKGETVLQN